MPAASGIAGHIGPRTDDHVDMVALHQFDQRWRHGRVIGPVTVGHDIDVGFDIREDALHDIALALPGFGSHTRACPAGDIGRAIGGVVVEDVDLGFGEGLPEGFDDRRDRRRLIVTGQRDRHAGGGGVDLRRRCARTCCHATHPVSLSVTTFVA